MYDIKKTGEIIKKLRMQKGKSLECIAEEMGINIKTYRAIEKGIRGGSVDTLCVIAKYHNVALDYLVFEQVPFDEKIDCYIKILCYYTQGIHAPPSAPIFYCSICFYINAHFFCYTLLCFSFLHSMSFYNLSRLFYIVHFFLSFQ